MEQVHAEAECSGIGTATLFDALLLELLHCSIGIAGRVNWNCELLLGIPTSAPLFPIKQCFGKGVANYPIEQCFGKPFAKCIG
jgi:hypothetical protein